MFDSIRDKFNSLQENISTTLRGLTVNETESREHVIKKINLVNINAGTAVLERFQTLWCELHEASQNNATRALEAYKLINNAHKTAERQWRDMANLTVLFASLPDVVHLVNDLCNKTVALKELFDSVEKGLIQLEDIIDKRELQNRQLDNRFQLELSKEKQLSNIENLKKNESVKASKEAPSSEGNLLEDIILENEDPNALEEFLNQTEVANPGNREQH